MKIRKASLIALFALATSFTTTESTAQDGFRKNSSAIVAQTSTQERLSPVPICDRNGKWGYADRNGKIIIPCKYDWVQPLKEGFTVITSGNRHIIIDKQGKQTAVKHLLAQLGIDCNIHTCVGNCLAQLAAHGANNRFNNLLFRHN